MTEYTSPRLIPSWNGGGRRENVQHLQGLAAKVARIGSDAFDNLQRAKLFDSILMGRLLLSYCEGQQCSMPDALVDTGYSSLHFEDRMRVVERITEANGERYTIGAQGDGHAQDAKSWYLHSTKATIVGTTTLSTANSRTIDPVQAPLMILVSAMHEEWVRGVMDAYRSIAYGRSGNLNEADFHAMRSRAHAQATALIIGAIKRQTGPTDAVLARDARKALTERVASNMRDPLGMVALWMMVNEELRHTATIPTPYAYIPVVRVPSEVGLVEEDRYVAITVTLVTVALAARNNATANTCSPNLPCVNGDGKKDGIGAAHLGKYLAAFYARKDTSGWDWVNGMWQGFDIINDLQQRGQVDSVTSLTL